MKKSLLLIIIPLLTFSQSNINDEFVEWKLHKNYLSYLNKKGENIVQNFYFKSSTPKKEVSITFDDGPKNNTKKIISYLLKNDIPATFFIISSQLNKNNILDFDNQLIEVGLHTYSHLDYSLLSRREKENDIKKCIDIFKKYNLMTNYFRPAYGIIDKEISDLLKKYNLQGIIWSIDSYDWNGYRGRKLVSHVIENLHPGAIILLHDRISINDLSDLISGINNKGFKIVPLKELMKYNSETPL